MKRAKAFSYVQIIYHFYFLQRNICEPVNICQIILYMNLKV
jgi:hypothetical protein